MGQWYASLDCLLASAMRTRVCTGGRRATSDHVRAWYDENLLPRRRYVYQGECFRLSASTTVVSEPLGQPCRNVQLNEKNLDGMDREDLTFWILNTKEEAVTEEVKLAAAEVLRYVILRLACTLLNSNSDTVNAQCSIVPMTEFNKQEVREVVTIFSSVPTIMSEKTYEIMANLLFLVFKMALVSIQAACSSCVCLGVLFSVIALFSIRSCRMRVTALKQNQTSPAAAAPFATSMQPKW